MYHKTPYMKLEMYIDVDYVRCIRDRRSRSGYCSFLDKNLIPWWSKKQLVVASVEVEFRVTTKGICVGI